MTDERSKRWLTRKPIAPEMVRYASHKEYASSWVLLAVLLCGSKGGTLRDIIACGDYANHAAFPFERLRNGFCRHQQTGLIECRNGIYRAASCVLRIW